MDFLKGTLHAILSVCLAGLILLLTCITGAQAETFYVSLRGSDRNSGTITEPFRTVRHAVSRVIPGDTIYVRGGDYRESFPGWDYEYIEGIRGTSTQPIIISAYQQEIPIFSKFTFKNCQWLVLNGFKILGYQPLYDDWKDMPNVIIDDPAVGVIDPYEDWKTREPKVKRKYATYIKLRDDFQKSWTYGISVNNTHNCTLKNNEITKFWAGVHISNGSSKNKIEKNLIHHTVEAVFTWSDSDKVSAEGNIISNNNFSQNLISSVQLMKSAKGNIIEHNISEYNGLSHMGTYSKAAHNIFRYNTLSHAGYYAETMQYPGPSGISIHSSEAGNVVEGNFIAYQLDNTGNDGGGIITDYTEHETIIKNNIVYRNMGHGFTSTYSGNNVILHNTFIENGYNSSKPKFGILFAMKTEFNNIIANNIFYKNKTGGILFNGLVNKQKFIDYNLYYQPKSLIAADKYWDKSTFYYDLATYQNRTGFGSHSIQNDPLFLNVDKGDFRLSAPSPAIDAATPLHSASEDKNGRPRPAGNGFDIGAYEYDPDAQ